MTGLQIAGTIAFFWVLLLPGIWLVCCEVARFIKRRRNRVEEVTEWPNVKQ